MALGMEVGFGPCRAVLDGDLPLKGAQPPPNFRPMSVVAKQLDGSRYHLIGSYRRQPSRHCVTWGPSSPQRGTAPNFRPMSVVAKRLDG